MLCVRGVNAGRRPFAIRSLQVAVSVVAFAVVSVVVLGYRVEAAAGFGLVEHALAADALAVTLWPVVAAVVVLCCGGCGRDACSIGVLCLPLPLLPRRLPRLLRLPVCMTRTDRCAPPHYIPQQNKARQSKTT